MEGKAWTESVNRISAVHRSKQTLRALRAVAPGITGSQSPPGNGTIAWLVTRYEDGVAVLANTQFAKDPLRAKADQGSKPPWLPAPLRALSRTMLDLDGADHRRLRGLVQNAFTPRVVDALRPRIETIATELLDAIEQRGRGTADLIAEYAAPIPVTVIAELLDS